MGRPLRPISPDRLRVATVILISVSNFVAVTDIPVVTNVAILASACLSLLDTILTICRYSRFRSNPHAEGGKNFSWCTGDQWNQDARTCLVFSCGRVDRPPTVGRRRASD
jgi:hypothetical protein